MQLVNVKISNFKAIKEVDIDLTDVTLLVGSNNCGKSSTLQAVHFASRAILQAAEANKQSTISIRELEYVPSEFYKDLAHNSQWGNRYDSPESKVTFTFKDDLGGNHVAKVSLKSARNEGISVNPTIAASLIPVLRGQSAVFSSYIPGLAGIPLQEQFLSKKNVFRKAASGDSNVVLRNILYILKQKNELVNTVSALRDVYNDNSVSVNVEYNPDSDYNIGAFVHTKNMFGVKPVEFSGTGMLQVMQIFSYLYLFRPSVILIDEPEAHLHPTLQTRLIQVLQDRVKLLKTKVLVTTHSPFIARGLAEGAETVWLADGQVAAATKGAQIRDALGWGALDKKAIICAEDRNTKPLENLLFQHPTLARDISVVPFSGVSKLGSGAALQAFRNALGNKHKLIVYRDRDCLTDDELEWWSKEYHDRGFGVLVSPGVEIENCYSDASHLSARLGISIQEAEDLLIDVQKQNEEQFLAKFKDKRREINGKRYKDGGSPETEKLWQESSVQRRVGGKALISGAYNCLDAQGRQRVTIDVVSSDLTSGLDLISAATKLLA